MRQSRLLAALSGAFSPPFKGLGFFVWGFFVWCFLVHPETAILHGAFGDSDDVVHLVRVSEWLQGQNWFDPVLHRLAPPEGVAIHYSRLAELPLAALIWPLHAMGLGWIAASYGAAFVWPLVLFAFFLIATRWAAAALLPPAWTRATSYVALFAVCVTMQFSPGRVDHHGLAAILVTLALGCVLRLMREPGRLAWPVGAGFFLAFGVAVGLEVLPWLLLFSGWVGVWLVIKGRILSLSSLVFGLSLYVFSALFLLAAVSPDSFYRVNPLSYSYLYVMISGGIALAIALTSLASLAGPVWLRGAAGALGITGFLAFFLLKYPALAFGPYGGMDPELSKLMLSSIREAAPLLNKAGSYGVFFATLFFPILGLVGALGFMSRDEGDAMGAWFFLSLLSIAAIFLACAYQIRVLLYAFLFAIVPLTELLRRGLAEARAVYKGRKLFAVELFLIMLVGPISAVLLPALSDGRSFREGVLLFPVVIKADTSCTPNGLWQVLNLPSLYGDRPRLVMNMMNEGAFILFHTKHKSMAAPYHTNVRGNLESTRFFRAKDAREAEKILRASGAELVLLCRDIPDLYKSEAAGTRVREDGTIEEKKKTNFVEQLVSGRVPRWLKRVEMPFMEKAMLFEARRP